MLAGHETTASTLTWLLYELCRHPEDQKRVRDELRELRQTLPAGAEFTIANLETLTFTNAVIKVSLYETRSRISTDAGLKTHRKFCDFTLSYRHYNEEQRSTTYYHCRSLSQRRTVMW